MKVGFVGAGHIARALGRGWSRPGLQDPPALTWYDVAPAAAAEAAAAAGGAVAASLSDLVAGSDAVIVAVRPQHVAAVLEQAAPLLGARPLVSVAAGVPLAALRAALPGDARVGRVMPNVAAALGLGLFLFVPGTLAAAEGDARALFALAGEVVPLDEDDFDTATALGGCMPGMLAKLVRDFARAGERRGLDPEVARRLAIAGVQGAAGVIADDGDPDAVVTATATPGGMTAAALASLEAHDVSAAVAAAVDAAAERAKELT